MSGDITTEAVRLALGMHEMQARIASLNIANASRPDARALRADFARVESALAEAMSPDNSTMAQLQQTGTTLEIPQAGAEPISVDEEVGDMVAASTNYQSLTEALSRHFGLMRLAIAGRS